METDAKKQRRQFYRDYASGHWSMGELCDRYQRVDDSTGGAPPPVGCRAARLRYERPALVMASRSAALCVCSLRIASLIVADAP